MKSIFVTFLVLFIVSLSLHSQVDRSTFKFGIHGGIPVGDAADVSSFTLGLDIIHFWSVSKQFDLGLASGFTNAFGDTDSVTSGNVTAQTGFDNVQFLPLAGAIRLYPTAKFNLGGDLGYAIGVNDGNEGGFYYRPTIAANVGGTTELNVAYTVVQGDVSNWTTLTLGFLIGF
ncbi:MAG: hypothetical protein HKP24_13080 [Croceitalea sp.]|nr:hypothetical protein [Croceitalea sp.]NNC34429.1 hypothetical protein [Croceitalea sp.]NNM19491.1 hypothetical protein [Croceitalea sp.]